MTADQTKRKILEATLETIKAEGITGTSARAIARTGDFNQALIFYHFGSIDDLLLAAVDFSSTQRMMEYRDRLDGVSTLPALAAVASQLHAEDLEQGNLTVLTQLMAAATGNAELGKRLRDGFDPWIDIVRDKLVAAAAGAPVAKMVPFDDLAMAVAALFIGVELLTHLDPDRTYDNLYDSIQLAAELVQRFIGDASDDPSRDAVHIPVE